MKKILHLLVFFFLFSNSLFSKQIVTLTNGEWPPYLSQSLPFYGAASHAVSEAFKAVDMEVKYTFLPWKRAYLNAKEGIRNKKKYHGTLVWVYTEDRAEDFIYSDEVVTDYEYLYFLKTKPIVWEKLEDLKEKVIGGTLHTSYPTLEEAQEKGILKIARAGNYNKLFQRLLAKRIDAVVQVGNVANYFQEVKLKKEERERIGFSKTILQRRHYYVIFSKNLEENKQIVEHFNKGLKIIKANGVYDKIWHNLNRGFYNKKMEGKK